MKWKEGLGLRWGMLIKGVLMWLDLSMVSLILLYIYIQVIYLLKKP